MIWIYMIFTWFCLVFFMSGLFINLLQLFVLPLFWINRYAYHVIINKLCYCVYSELTFMAEWWGNFDLKVYGDADDIFQMPAERSIIVLNHFSDVDWLGSYVFCERTNFLASTKVLMKGLVKYVPVIGWCWWFAEYGFLARNWSKDEASLMKVIDGRKKCEVPYVIALFCEGTRRTREKLKASQEYAIEKNIHPLKHHLIPRTKGFSIVVNSLKDHITSIYDVEFAFPDPDNSTIPTLINRGTVDAHVYLRRIPISEVPCDTEEEASTYLMNLFKEKDENMEYFEQHGKFPAPLVHLPRKTFNLVTFIIFNICVGGVVATVLNCFVNLYGLATVAIFMFVMGLILFLLVLFLVKLTQTTRGSTFGLKMQKKKE